MPLITITIRQNGEKATAESMKIEVEKLKGLFPDANISYSIIEKI